MVQLSPSSDFVKEEVSGWCWYAFNTCRIFAELTFNFFCKDFIYLFLERGEGREGGREKSICGCLSSAPYWGPGPQPRHAFWLGIEPVTFWFTGRCSTHWATPARASFFIYYFFLFIEFIVVTRLTKLYRFQVHDSATHHLYTVLYVNQSKSSLLPSPFPSPHPPPPLPSPPPSNRHTVVHIYKVFFFFLFLFCSIPPPPVLSPQLTARSLSMSLKPKILIQKNICTPMFIAALFTIAKIWKQPKCPSVAEWIKKLQYIYTMECYSAIKRRKSYPL